MQCTSYLSGYYYSREQNADASGSLWQQFNNGFFCRSGRDYNISTQQPIMDQYLAYNKDILRQTMLKHEALFMYQVRELHRLYGRQRELMDEIKMMELSKDHLRMQTSSSNSFVSGMLCDTSKKALQIPSWLLSNPRDDKASAHGVDNFQRPLSFVSRKSIQADSDVYVADNHLKELEVSLCGRNKYGKRMLNLELPPVESMDSDRGEELEREKSFEACPVWHDPSIKFAHSSPKSNITLKKGVSSNFNSSCRTSCLFDLNEPLPSDEPVSTISTSLIDSNTNSTEIMLQDQDLSGKPISKTPQLREIAPDVLKGKGIMEANSGLQVQSTRMSSLCNDETTFGSKSTKKDRAFDVNEQRVLSSCVTTSSQLVHVSEQTNPGASTSISSRKTSDIEVPTAIQALPCFTATQSSKTSRASSGSSVIKGMYLNGNPASFSNLGCNTSHTSCNSSNQLNAENVANCVQDQAYKILLVDMDLNTAPSSSVPEIEDSQDKDQSMDGEKKHDNSVGPLDGAKVKPDSEGRIGGCPQLLDPPISGSQFCEFTAIDSISNLSEEKDIQNGEIDLPVIHISCDSSYKSQKSPKDDETCPPNDCGKEMSQSNTCVDLQFSGMDQKHSQVLSETTAVGTDLQAPISPDNKEQSPPREESEDNQSEKLEGTNKELDWIAAEAILLIMLSGRQRSLNTSMIRPLEFSVNCLDWFAGIACTVAGGGENEFRDLLNDGPGGNCSDLAPKALEHWETTTFKFTGIKVEDHCHMIIDQKNKLMGDVLQTSQGQSRKTRGWKEFQSQDLSSASSLCSYDVTDNLRPIGKLRTAARAAHETVKVRKKVGRVNCAKGRRHSKRFPLNTISRRVCSLSKQNTCQSEQSFLQSCSFGWGKKCGRQKHRRARSKFDLGFN